MAPSPPLRVSELPPRASSGVQYQVIVETDDEEGVYLLPEGTTYLGQADRCDIQIRAAGVQTRHVALKRNGDRIVARRPAPDASETTDVRPIALDDPFHVGAATVRVRRVAPGDHAAAVELALRDRPADVPAVPVRTRLGDTVGQVDDEAARQIRRLTDALGPAMAAGRLRAEVVLDALHDCTAPNAAALFWHPDDEPAGRWACTSVQGTVTPPAPPEASDDWVCVRHETGEGTLALVVHPSGATTAAWQAALYRHVTALAAWARRSTNSTPPDASTVHPPDGDVWDRFVGRELRRHLQPFTELCTYARSVLVVGETGTGKELASQALHHRVWECDGPLVALNCAAVPNELLEAELFGVEEGAATGVRARPGRFEQARGGTLFLDEVAEMPTALQSKLLRVLQERTYVRLGGSELLDADVHIVAATNRPEATLRDGTHMRPDLYFRLAQATVPLPPLRERRADVPALCEYFLGDLEARFGRGVRGISVSALRALQDYTWPGNVRELKNVLRSVYARTPPGALATRHHLPDTLRSTGEAPASTTDSAAPGDAASSGDGTADAPETAPDSESTAAPAFGDAYDSLDAFLTAVEREAIARALNDHDRVADAAERLDLSPSYLYRKIKAHDLDPG